MDAAAVIKRLQAEGIVSRETISRLGIYAEQVAKWNPRINLIAKNSFAALWFRHFYDSLQIIPHVPADVRNWLDVGSGGGFPALVLAAHFDDIAFTLVESDQRKSAFLRQTGRMMGLTNLTIRDQRIEMLAEGPFDAISARALADLEQLFVWLARFGKDDGLFIFPKGKNWQSELTKAGENWHYHMDAITSQTNAEARLLLIRELRKK